MAGVFYYMRLPEIWSKFTETSQYMEELLDDFDILYPWDGNTAMNVGQLERPDRDPNDNLPLAGLRDLYCFWIDSTLAGIEQKAAAWLPAATANFKAQFGSDIDGKKWLDNVIGAYISVTNLKFLHTTGGQHSPNPSNPDIWVQSNYQGLWRTNLGPAGPF